MDNHTRRAISFIVGRLISGQSKNSVYDYLVGKFYFFSGDVSDNHVSVYDYEKSCYIAGNKSSFYHYGNSAYISLDVKGLTFSGYDYKSSGYFSGTVSGNDVSFYDFAMSKYFNYSLA